MAPWRRGSGRSTSGADTQKPDCDASGPPSCGYSFCGDDSCDTCDYNSYCGESCILVCDAAFDVREV